MNSCLDEETLSAYCDGVLDPHEQARVEAHLQQCWHCRRVESDYRSLGSKIGHLPDLDVPADFRQKIISGLAASSRPAASSQAGRKWWQLSWVRAAAAVVVLAALAVPGYSLYLKYEKGGTSPLKVPAARLGTAQGSTQSDSSLSAGNLAGGSAPGTAAPQVGSQQATGRGETKSAANTKQASVELHVQDVKDAGQEVLRQATASAGAEVSFLAESGGIGRITLLVPGADTQAFLAGLDKIGKVVTVTSWGNIADPSGVTVLNINIVSP